MRSCRDLTCNPVIMDNTYSTQDAYDLDGSEK